MYDFIRAQDHEELGFDEEEHCNCKFQLMQPNPRKVFAEDSSQTLGDVGLHPRAMLTVVEL
jgi:hypothetical protein